MGRSSHGSYYDVDALRWVGGLTDWMVEEVVMGDDDAGECGRTTGERTAQEWLGHEGNIWGRGGVQQYEL